MKMIQRTYERLPEDETGALFSPCNQYRYLLWRRWVVGCRDSQMIAFVGLNPSTADATNNDPTIRRCIGFAKSWGYSGLVMLNLFGWRSTTPDVLRGLIDPIGPGNDEAIDRVANRVNAVVLCYGVHGALNDRGKAVRESLSLVAVPKYHLGLSAAGHPKHPLYLRADTKPTLL